MPDHYSSYSGSEIDSAIGAVSAKESVWDAKPTLSEALSAVYPVGSIYMSINSTNPGTLFGGTWEQLQDTFLLAAGASYAAGSTGGEANHQLTWYELPTHNHGSHHYFSGYEGWPYTTVQFEDSGYVFNWTNCVTNPWAGPLTAYIACLDYPPTANTGMDVPHNNMPPYLTVYMWKRTA